MGGKTITTDKRKTVPRLTPVRVDNESWLLVRDNTQDGGAGEFWNGRATKSPKEILVLERCKRANPAIHGFTVEDLPLWSSRVIARGSGGRLIYTAIVDELRASSSQSSLL